MWFYPRRPAFEFLEDQLKKKEKTLAWTLSFNSAILMMSYPWTMLNLAFIFGKLEVKDIINTLKSASCLDQLLEIDMKNYKLDSMTYVMTSTFQCQLLFHYSSIFVILLSYTRSCDQYEDFPEGHCCWILSYAKHDLIVRYLKSISQMRSGILDTPTS